MSRLIEFEKLSNVRDLGGQRTADGRAVAGGRLIRCGHLNGLTKTDAEKLGVLADTIVDFRTPGECGRQPDDAIPGAVRIHLPVMETMTAGITREKESDEQLFKKCLRDSVRAKEYMIHTYRNFAVGEFAVSQYAKFLQILLEPHERAVVWHCTAGKDRTGTAAAIVEEILGVPRETVFADYLATNQYIQKDYEFVCKMVKRDFQAEGPAVDESLKLLFLAQREYLENWYAAVEEKYGSFVNFVKEGLGLQEEERQRLREKYLED